MDINEASENLLRLAPSQNPQDPLKSQQPKPASAPTVQPVSPDPFVARAIAKQDREREQYFLARIQEAVKTNPDAYARALKLATQFNVPSDQIEKDPKLAEEFARQSDVFMMDFVHKNPVLGDFLSNPTFAKMTSDEFRNLSEWEMLYGRFRQGAVKNEKFRLYEELRGLNEDPANLKTDRGREIYTKIKEADAELNAWYRPQDELSVLNRPLDAVADMLGQMSTTTPKAMAAGGAAAVAAIVTGFPEFAPKAFEAGALLASGWQTANIESGAALESMLQKGIPFDTAKDLAPWAGYINGATEVIGTKIASYPLKKVVSQMVAKSATTGAVEELLSKMDDKAMRAFLDGKLTKEVFGDLAHPLAGEFFEEFSQGVTTSYFENRGIVEAAKQRGETVEMPEIEWRQSAWEGLQAGLTAMIMGAPFAGRGSYSDSLHYSRLQAEISKRQMELKTAQENAEAQKNLKLGQRDPDVLAQLDKAAAQHHSAPEHVYINANDLVNVLMDMDQMEAKKLAKEQNITEAEALTRVDNLAKFQAMFPAQSKMLLAARNNNADVMIPFAEWKKHPEIVDGDLGKNLQRHIRFNVEDQSLFYLNGEADVLRKTLTEDQTARKEQALKDAAYAREFTKSAKTVEIVYRDDIANLKTEDGQAKFTPTEAKTLAIYVRDMYSMLAQRLGMKPDEVMQRYSYQVKTGFGVGRGAFDPKSATATINETGEISTFFHETAHFFTDVLYQIANQKDAPVELLEDVKALNDWFGVGSIEAWNALPDADKRKYSERFAHNYEIMLAEGKHPTEKLRKAYTTYSDLLKRVYQSAKQQIGDAHKMEYGEELPALTGEIRKVMDRMLATREQLDYEMKVAGFKSLFQTREEFQGTDEEWAALQAAEKESQEQAKDDLDSASYNTVRWLDNKRTKMLRALDREERALRSGVYSEEEAKLRQERVYQARAELRGENAPKDMPADARAKLKLNRKQAREIVNASKVGLGDGLKDFTRIEERLKRELHNDGQDLHEAAELLGYGGDVLAMLKELLTAPELSQAVADRTEQRMLAEHEGLATKERQQALVDGAIQNEARMRMVALELNALEKNQRPANMILAAAKRVAQDRLGKMSLREISSRKFSRLAAQKSKEAQRALKAGKNLDATIAKREEIVLSAMAREAATVQREVSGLLRYFKKFSVYDPKKYDAKLIQLGRAILGIFDLGPMAGPEYQSELKQIARLDPEFDQYAKQLLEEWETKKLTNRQADFKDMSVEQMRELRGVLDQLYTKSQRNMKAEIEGQTVTVANHVEKGRESLREHLKDPKQVEEVGKRKLSEKNWDAVRSLENVWLYIEDIFRMLDGGKRGFFSKLFGTVREAETQRSKDLRVYSERMARIIKKHSHLFDNDKQIRGEGLNKVGEPIHVFGRGDGRGIYELTSCILHHGTQYSYVQNLISRGWGEWVTDANGKEVFNDSRWREFQEKLIREGVLTADHFNFIKEYHDLLQTQEFVDKWRKANYKINGDYAEMQETRTEENSLGKWELGYWPASKETDFNVDIDAREQPLDTRSDMLADLNRMHASMTELLPLKRPGFTITRIPNVERKLAFDMDLGRKHVRDALQFANMAPAVADVNKILGHPALRQDMNAYLKGVYEEMVIPWLTRSLTGDTTMPTKYPGFRRLLNFFRANISAARLGWSVIQATQNVTGIYIAKVADYGEMDAKYLFEARDALFRNGIEYVSKKSAYMDDRNQREVSQYAQEVDDFLKRPGRWWTAQRYLNDLARSMDRFVRQKVDCVVWVAKYNHSLAQIGDTLVGDEKEREAVRRADAFVRRTQTDFSPVDMSSGQVMGDIGKAIFQFAAYGNRQFARQYVDIKMAGKANLPLKAPRLIGHVLLSALGEAVIANAIRNFWAGGTSKEEPETPMDYVYDYVLNRDLGTYLLGQVPVAGPVMITGVNLFDNKRYNDALPVGPMADALLKGGIASARLIKAGLSDEVTSRPSDWRNAASFLHVLSGVPLTPVGRIGNYWAEVGEGKIEPTGTWDQIRAMMALGQASPASRR